jgi:hypothetical protein
MKGNWGGMMDYPRYLRAVDKIDTGGGMGGHIRYLKALYKINAAKLALYAALLAVVVVAALAVMGSGPS